MPNILPRSSTHLDNIKDISLFVSQEKKNRQLEEDFKNFNDDIKVEIDSDMSESKNNENNKSNIDTKIRKKRKKSFIQTSNCKKHRCRS